MDAETEAATDMLAYEQHENKNNATEFVVDEDEASAVDLAAEADSLREESIADSTMVEEPERASGVESQSDAGAFHVDAFVVAMMSRMEALTTAFDETNRISRERERVVDRLHEENQRLRAGERGQAMTPVWRDLIRLYDDLTKGAALGTDEVAAELSHFAGVVTDILYRHAELEPYEASVGTSFNPREHKATGTDGTEDVDKDRTLAQILRVGFRSDACVFRPLEARVYRLASDRVQQMGEPVEHA